MRGIEWRRVPEAQKMIRRVEDPPGQTSVNIFIKDSRSSKRSKPIIYILSL